MAKKTNTLKKFTKFRPLVLSRHPSHSILRTELPLFPFRSVIRLGSVTVPVDGKERVETNTVNAIKNSADKLLMKQCFTAAGVMTAEWNKGSELFNTEDNALFFTSETRTTSETAAIEFPIVAKHRKGSRGTGNYLLSSQEEFVKWVVNKNLSNYIFEKFYSYSREYRLHVTDDGCFYTCRKVLRSDTPTEDRWKRNDATCSWLVESNESFDKPVNWVAIEAECVKALNAVGLDFGACDVKVQSATTSKGKVRTDPKFIIIEINSAPSYGDGTAQKYLEQLPIILTKKFSNLKK